MILPHVHDPIHREKRHEGKASYIGFVFSTIVFILLLILTIYWYQLGEYFWIGTEFAFGALILFGFFMYLGWKGIKGENVLSFQFVLNEKGITRTNKNETTGQEDITRIPFENIERVLMGNCADYIRAGSNGGISFYRFYILFIVIHRDGLYFELIYTKDDLEDWVQRFQNKQVPISYTEMDLYPAFLDYSTHQVDFTQIQGAPWEDGGTTYPLVGEEGTGTPYTTWDHGGKKYPKVDENIRKDTNKAEKRNVLFLLMNALFVGAFMLPTLFNMDMSGPFLIENTLYLGIFLVNIIFPVIMVYMRSFTKWYMPFVYFIIVSIGELIGILAAAPFSTLPDMVEIIQGVANMNGTLLAFGWYPFLILIKLVKFIFRWMDRHNVELP